MTKDKRNEIRIPLLAEAVVYTCVSLADKGLLTVPLIDISPKGAFIKGAYLPKIGESVSIRLEMPSELGIIELEGIVKWSRWAVKKNSPLPIGFGIEFKFNADKTDLIVSSYCTYLRNKQIIAVSKRIIDAFFPQGPTIL